MMSGKKKSRNILSLPTTTENKESGNTIQNQLDISLKLEVSEEPGTPINSLSTNTSDLEGMLDLGIKISGLSSSSSLSWSEEYESELSQKLQLELEKLDRIFQGVENDSSPYDINEIKEWRQHFPHLCILGHNTPTNSVENSDADTNSEDEIFAAPRQQPNFAQKHTIFPKDRSSLASKRRQELATQDVFNPIRNYHSLPRKPRSLEIDQYLKISSIRSPETRKLKQNSQPVFIKQTSKELSGDVSPEYTSLPFITATPLKTQIRKRNERNRAPKLLFLPPIENTFRSISATPRQASSKSMYVSLNYERNSSKKATPAAKLKSDLMKLFDHIPISNR